MRGPMTPDKAAERAARKLIRRNAGRDPRGRPKKDEPAETRKKPRAGR